jgi:hypothetical protein
MVVDRESGKSVESEARTSSGVFLTKTQVRIPTPNSLDRGLEDMFQWLMDPCWCAMCGWVEGLCYGREMLA